MYLPAMTSSDPQDGARPGHRIAKLLARAGVASRREIERMIAEGRVALNGAVLDTPATILPSLTGVSVDGRPVAAPEAARLFLYHKPAGLLVTERDPAGRPTIYDRLPRDLPRTVPVGRLDLATEGLLLLTTDGGLKRQLELPATGVERTYRARAYGDVTQAMLEELIDGVEIEGVRYGSIDANLERRTGANVWIELTLTEGKNREVRRVLEHLGLQVGRLIRTRYGPFVLGDLPPGEVGEVKQHDLVAFTKTLGGARRAKGADLQSLVTVEPRARPARPAPATVPAPRASAAAETATRRPRPAAPAGAAKPASGWGSRTRPSRPAPAAEAAKPERFRAADARRPRDDEERRAAGSRGRADGERPGARPRRTDGDQRGERPTGREVDERPRAASSRTPGGERPARSASDPRPRTAKPGATARPGKGPAGGRGHPPRGGKGAPPRGPKGKR